MILIFAKILSVFSISFIGFFANKINWLPIDSTKYLSQILVNIASPCLVLYSMGQQELTSATLASVTQVALLMLLMLVTATVIAVPIVKIMKVPVADRGVYRMLLVLTNNGFMGYPLSLAVFGEKGLFLMIIANAIFTIYLYSVGVFLLIYDKDGKLDLKGATKSIFSIPVVTSIAGLLIFILGFQFPSLVENFLYTVGAMTIPLSMLIIGIQLAESKIGEVIRNKHLFYVVILKLVLIPVVLFVICMNFNIIPFVLCIAVFAMAMPSAAVIAVLADIYNANARLAAEGVFVTTLFSLITIPIYAILLTLYLGV